MTKEFMEGGWYSAEQIEYAARKTGLEESVVRRVMQALQDESNGMIDEQFLDAKAPSL